MISQLIKKVMQETGLNQVRLAEVIGASLSRVKSITSGRVQKLSREESEALVRKLHVRAEWLVTGEGPMFQTPAEQEFQRRLDTVAKATGQAVKAGLNQAQVDLLQRIMLAAETGDADTLAKLLRPLSTRAAALVDSYEHLTETDQRAIERTASALAQSTEVKPTRRKSK